MTVDALRLKKLGGGSEEWAFASGDTSSFIKMSIGKNAEIDATDYNVQAITEVNVTQKIMGIETEPDEVEIITEPRMVSIREGNKLRLMSGIKKLRVNLQSGGTTELVPKSSVSTGTLYATKIGEYKAADDGYVGYSRVYVNVPESVPGSGGADGGWTDLPDEIRVTTPPTKTDYTEGESINYDGIIVKAYKGGTVWENEEYPKGIIPFNELILNNDFYKSSELIGDIKIKDAKEINVEVNNLEWEFGRYNDAVKDYEVVAKGNEQGTAKIYDRDNSGSRFCILWADTERSIREYDNSPQMLSICGILTAMYSSKSISAYNFLIGNGESPIPSESGRVYDWNATFMGGGPTPGGSKDYWQGNNLDLQANNYARFPRAQNAKYIYTYDGKSAYYHYHQTEMVSGFIGRKYKAIDGGASNVFVSLPYPNMAYQTDTTVIGYYPAANNRYSIYELGMFAWTMLYGDTNVLVQWARPRDNKILSTFFKITIVES